MAQLEVADVFRQFGPSYLEAFGERMPPSHRRAIEDIVACRTPAMGGHAYFCRGCGKTFYACHGCRNRACPACHTTQTRQWLEARSAEVLPCAYYHVCITVPNELRATFRANQNDCYALFMKAASTAVLALCADQRYLGAVPAVLSVLHTWTAAMDYHPHVHLLVSGAGLGLDGTSWREAGHPFLLPVRALSRLVRGQFMALLKTERPDLEAPVATQAWKREWVAWCKPWGKGETAVLTYLARYIHRIAITNGRIRAMDDRTVTFRYKHRKTGEMRTCTVSGHEFMRRYLQHVLPKGFHKVRYGGLWHSSKRPQRQNLCLTCCKKHKRQRPRQRTSLSRPRAKRRAAPPPIRPVHIAAAPTRHISGRPIRSGTP
jgi:hypothetical protein